MQSVWAYWLWWESWIWSEHESHLPQICWHLSLWMGGGAVEGRARVRTRCEPGLWCSVETHQGAGAEALRVGPDVSIPFVYALLTALASFPEGLHWSKRGGSSHSVWAGACAGLSWHIRVHTTLFIDAELGLSRHHPFTSALPLDGVDLHPSGELWGRSKMGQDVHWGGREKQLESQAVSVCFLCLVLGARKQVYACP